MDYEKLKIHEFENWNLYLHENQFPYIGRSYAWVNGEGNELSDMSRLERDELFDIIIPTWEKAIERSLGAARTNLAVLGNTSPHLHAHLIPRYIKAINFLGRIYEDPNPNKNYAPYPKLSLEEKELFKIKDFFKNHFPK